MNGNIENDTRSSYYSDVDFKHLMDQRIQRVLLLCSKYDAFMLEEDGRIDEQIFNEYVQLNLRYPPKFIQVSTDEEALHVLHNENIDLVINMLSVGGMDAFELSRLIKKEYEEIPIVVLAPLSREISLRLETEDMSAVEYVFSWLGHADLLLAIVKLMEDKLNAEHDVLDVGVNAILLVEDSIPFYSSYLPNIYKIMISQAKKFMSEGLNEHQKTMRMRGRPKIILANNYDEAIELFEKYKHNLLGIISDISYEREGSRDDQAGLNLCKHVREVDRTIPFLLQSTMAENKIHADRLLAGFIHKNSKTLLQDLKSYLLDHLAFGDFIFIDPNSGEEYSRAANLRELQLQVMEIPDEVLKFHVSRDHISKWLRARALFRIANMFRYVRPEHFNNIDEVRKFIYDSIAGYRRNIGRGVIAKYNRRNFDDYINFSRMGDGSIGGKARGLAFIDLLLKQHQLHHKYDGVFISIPRTVIVATDYFDRFMELNGLYDIALNGTNDKEILHAFRSADLPKKLILDLKAYLKTITKPIAVRSSSLLEDSHYQPFAGIYATFMIPISQDKEANLRHLSSAIKSVYASVYFEDSKAYMSATKNMIDEEKMAIVLQEVCGEYHDDVYMPTFSGVARSINFYPIGDEDPNDGVVQLALGLGKHIVDGNGVNLMYSPSNPKKILQLSSPDMALRDTQKDFFALEMKIDDEIDMNADEDFNIVKRRLSALPKAKSFRPTLSSYDFTNHMLRDSFTGEGKPVVTFAHILKYNKFPLNDIIKEILKIGENAMNYPVEIEFAVQLPEHYKDEVYFRLLQIRPTVESNMQQTVSLENINPEDTIISSNSSIGNGNISGIQDIIYVRPDNFSSKHNREISEIIGKLNKEFDNDHNYILIGPGRWGSKDDWLGIPVTWSQISHSRMIVEASLSNYHIDPSQGTHFFQNLTSFHVGYLTVNQHLKDGLIDYDYIDALGETIYEDHFVRHVRLPDPVEIVLDGKSKSAVVYKPRCKFRPNGEVEC